MYAICRYYVGKIFLKPLDFSKLSQNYVGMYAILSKKNQRKDSYEATHYCPDSWCFVYQGVRPRDT